MANTSPCPIGVGDRVCYNVKAQSPLAEKPAPDEKGVGLVKQMFRSQGQKYYQVIWKAGGAKPEVALYTEDQLCLAQPPQGSQTK